MRQRILDAAREEFLLSGFARASMRAIAAQAGMTVGNIYLYFAGKEQLFDALVGDTVRQVHTLMQLSSASDEGLRWLADGLHSVFMRNRVEFLILISRSDGSKYENLKETIIDFARRKLPEQFHHPDNEGLFSPVAVALIEGLLDIFNHCPDDEAKLTADLYRFLNYMLTGLVTRRRTEVLPCED